MHRGIAVQSSGIFLEVKQDVANPLTGERRKEVVAVLPHELCEQRRIECEVGEVLTFTVPFRSTCRYSLERKPEGSQASIAGNKLVNNDRPGVYVVMANFDGLFTRRIEVCAYHPNQVYGGSIGDAAYEKRLQFRGYVNDPERTMAECVERLESVVAQAAIAQNPRVEVNVPDGSELQRPPVPAKRAKQLSV